MPATASDKGLKRICPTCGTRYYDLGKRPVICPNCSTEFTGELKVKARRGRANIVEEEPNAAPIATSKEPADDEDDIIADPDTVSLDEVEAIEGADADDDADAAEDIEVDDDLDVALDDDLEEDVLDDEPEDAKE